MYEKPKKQRLYPRKIDQSLQDVSINKGSEWHWYRVLQHKKSGRYIFFLNDGSLTPEYRSAIRFRRRIYGAIEKFSRGLFLTLTYSADKYGRRSNRDISAFFHRFRTYSKRQGWRLTYAWHNDFGRTTGREHFHAMVGMADLQGRYFNCFIPNKRSEKLWSLGFTSTRRVYSASGARSYLAHYVSKHKEVVVPPEKVVEYKRRFGCSQDIPKTPKSQYRYIGIVDKKELLETYVNANLQLENQRIAKNNRLLQFL